jgi:hypothetical protein
MMVMAQSTVQDTAVEVPDTIPASWAFEADILYYIFPEASNTATLIGYADYKAWHLEARYNYEDENSVSLFGGYRFDVGQKVAVGFTPMLGILIGPTSGLIPGLEVDITWKKLDFYSESEYVLDLGDGDGHYFYTWAELAISPMDHWRTGISVNRTRLYESSLDLQRGAFVQYSFSRIRMGIHYFNPFTDEDFILTTLAVAF